MAQSVNHLGDQILNGKLESDDPRVFYSATKDSRSGTIFLKIVNASTLPLELKLKYEGTSALSSAATLWTLTGVNPAQTNSIDQPNAITPQQSQIAKLGPEDRQQLAPLSINVIEIRP